jgi:hypothetical protein
VTARQDNNARILVALRKGPVRVTDWSGPTPPDGGAPITHVPRRVADLRDAGWPVEKTGTVNHQPVFELVTGTARKKAA